MKLAVIGDVHANLPALEAVLAAIEVQRVDRVLCMGDTVGYHAEPVECLRLIEQVADAGVLGNHDWMALGGDLAAGTNPLAERVVAWTRARLDRAARKYLAGLPRCAVDPSGAVLAHGCFLNDEFHRGYTTSLTLTVNLHVVALCADWPQVALCGHTHVPMCGWLDADGATHEADVSAPVQWPADARSVLINPGSVGQPRDGDPRASFAVVDTGQCRMRIHRVVYDIEKTTDAMRRAGLPMEVANRLQRGR